MTNAGTADVTLLDDHFAPVTSSIGFLRAPHRDVVDALVAWRRGIHGTAEAHELTGGLPENITRLEPLTGGVRPRELVVATASAEWTALFDCGVQGGDPVTTVGYLSRTMLAQGVAITSIPDRQATDTQPDRYGARQFELFGPLATDFMNYVRTVSVVRDGARWRFDAAGTVQDFEDTDAYTRRKVADRFTPEMLVAYAAEVGLRPFDDDFYPGPCTLVTNPAAVPPGGLCLSIDETRRRAGIATS